MADLKGGTIGVLLAIFGIMLTVYGWFWIPAIADALPIGLLTAIFYIGLISTWTLSFVITPYIFIIGGNASLLNVGKGCIAFFGGTFFSLIAYYIVPQIIEIGEEIFSANDSLSGIGWAMLIILWIITMVILPAYFITKDMIMKGGMSE